MAIPDQRDLGEARRTIERWMAARRPEHPDLAVSELTQPAGTGFSNETLLFDVSWRQGAGRVTESLVLRVRPSGYRVFMEDDFEQQHQILTELGRRGLRVPPVHELETDPSFLGAPFFLMSKVEGQIPGDTPPYNAEGWLFDMTPAERHRVWRSAVDALCEVHRVGADAELAFLSKPHRGPSGLEQQLCYYEESLHWAAQGRSQPVAEAAWAWLASHVPARKPTALSWGDARFANMVFGGTECRALLDWEMVSLGGPEMDLGWWLFLDRFCADGYGLQRLDGLGTRQETIDLWEAQTGYTASDIEFYEVFAGFRFAIVMMRLAQMFHQWGWPVDPDMESDNAVTRLLADLLGIPTR